ncbi:unnamed protein product [Amoebophrya sp. A25]|nr:unnamed protein product [Amoebophrya sp. A25]|eukprot:GSA25T00016592001.1
MSEDTSVWYYCLRFLDDQDQDENYNAGCRGRTNEESDAASSSSGGLLVSRLVRFADSTVEYVDPPPVDDNGRIPDYKEDFFRDAIAPCLSDWKQQECAATVDVEDSGSLREEVERFIKRTAIFCRVAMPTVHPGYGSAQSTTTGGGGWRLTRADVTSWLHILQRAVGADSVVEINTHAAAAEGVPQSHGCASTTSVRDKQVATSSNSNKSMHAAYKSGALASRFAIMDEEGDAVEEEEKNDHPDRDYFNMNTSASSSGTTTDNGKGGNDQNQLRRLRQFLAQICVSSGFAGLHSATHFLAVLTSTDSTLQGLAEIVSDHKQYVQGPTSFPSCVSWDCCHCSLASNTPMEDSEPPAFCTACGSHWSDSTVWQCDCGVVCRFAPAFNPQEVPGRGKTASSQAAAISSSGEDVLLKILRLLPSASHSHDPGFEQQLSFDRWQHANNASSSSAKTISTREVKDSSSGGRGLLEEPEDAGDKRNIDEDDDLDRILSNMELPMVGQPVCPVCGWLRPVVRQMGGDALSTTPHDKP